jgi:hypothetical protein
VPHGRTAPDSLARQVDTVETEFRSEREIRPGPPRNGSLDRPAGAERPRGRRSKRLVAFMGANDLSRAAVGLPSRRMPEGTRLSVTGRHS